VRKSLNDSASALITVAGNGSAEFTSHLLDRPTGIFVTETLDLYVADYEHGRTNSAISRRRTEWVNSGREWDNGDNPTSWTIAIVLNADEYLFIVDQWNHRIAGSGPYYFRCLVGCSGSGGTSSDLLAGLFNLSFDTDGSIFVIDEANSLLLDNTCGKRKRTMMEKKKIHLRWICCSIERR
jgi:hypothetical protein